MFVLHLVLTETFAPDVCNMLIIHILQLIRAGFPEAIAVDHGHRNSRGECHIKIKCTRPVPQAKTEDRQDLHARTSVQSGGSAHAGDLSHTPREETTPVQQRETQEALNLCIADQDQENRCAPQFYQAVFKLSSPAASKVEGSSCALDQPSDTLSLFGTPTDAKVFGARLQEMTATASSNSCSSSYNHINTAPPVSIRQDSALLDFDIESWMILASADNDVLQTFVSKSRATIDALLDRVSVYTSRHCFEEQRVELFMRVKARIEAILKSQRDFCFTFEEAQVDESSPSVAKSAAH